MIIPIIFNCNGSFYSAWDRKCLQHSMPVIFFPLYCGCPRKESKVIQSNLLENMLIMTDQLANSRMAFISRRILICEMLSVGCAWVFLGLLWSSHLDSVVLWDVALWKMLHKLCKYPSIKWRCRVPAYNSETPRMLTCWSVPKYSKKGAGALYGQSWTSSCFAYTWPSLVSLN